MFGPQLMNVHCKPSLPLNTSLFLNFIDSYRKKQTETQTNTIAVHIAFWSTNETDFLNHFFIPQSMLLGDVTFYHLYVCSVSLSFYYFGQHCHFAFLCLNYLLSWYFFSVITFIETTHSISIFMHLKSDISSFESHTNNKKIHHVFCFGFLFFNRERRTNKNHNEQRYLQKQIKTFQYDFKNILVIHKKFVFIIFFFHFYIYTITLK